MSGYTESGMLAATWFGWVKLNLMAMLRWMIWVAGGILRDHNGLMLAAYVAPLSASDPYMAELHTLFLGISLCLCRCRCKLCWQWADHKAAAASRGLLVGHVGKDAEKADVEPLLATTTLLTFCKRDSIYFTRLEAKFASMLLAKPRFRLHHLRNITQTFVTDICFMEVVDWYPATVQPFDLTSYNGQTGVVYVKCFSTLRSWITSMCPVLAVITSNCKTNGIDEP